MRTFILAGLIALTGTTAGYAQHAHQPYAGLQEREISTLSPDDIAELEAGRGWGLALPAELNGYPGPAHVLELADDLALSAEQREQTEAIFMSMQADAITAGQALIGAERALDAGFALGSLTPERLQELIAAAARARGDLRYVHLSRHLQMVDLLTPSQVERYNLLRGYADDPCATVPEGHDPDMWRRHNGCGE